MMYEEHFVHLHRNMPHFDFESLTEKSPFKMTGEKRRGWTSIIWIKGINIKDFQYHMGI